jgi:electron transfer flavoprotein beta subunit
LNVLVCVKRVPETGAKITLTSDEQAIDTAHLGFTISPHEECAVEEALRLAAAHGGTTTVLTLGPPEAAEQLRNAMAMGIDDGVLLETDGSDWDPQATAAAIVDAVRSLDPEPDLLLFGNESADSGGYQVGIRVARALDLPCVTGAKAIEVSDGGLVARRESAGGWESFAVSLPAVVTVKEGINLPRYPSLPGRLKAKKKELHRLEPVRRDGGLVKVRLRVPPDEGGQVEILGNGAGAAPKVVELLAELGVLE